MYRKLQISRRSGTNILIFINLTSSGSMALERLLHALLFTLLGCLLGQSCLLLLGTEELPGQLLARLRGEDQGLGRVQDVRLLVL